MSLHMLYHGRNLRGTNLAVSVARKKRNTLYIERCITGRTLAWDELSWMEMSKQPVTVPVYLMRNMKLHPKTNDVALMYL
jgi:hypothetical protein